MANFRSFCPQPRVRLLWVCLVLAAVMGAEAGTPTPPVFLSPSTPISTDTTTIAIPAIIGDKRVATVWFYAQYHTSAPGPEHDNTVNKLIAVDSTPPFETLWDCSPLPDQDNRHLQLSCVVQTRDDPRKEALLTFKQPATLDRTTKHSDRTIHALHTTRPLAFDGDLSDWPDHPSVSFAHQDNRITARACWTSHFLCFAIRVDDTAIFATPQSSPAGIDSIMPLPRQDGVDIFLDLFDNKTSSFLEDDYRIAISPNGRLTIDSPIAIPDSSYRPLLAVQLDERGYTVELALSWTHLPFSPLAEETIGLNIVNRDREAFTGGVTSGNLAAIPAYCLYNPSEWLSLKLTRPRARWPWYVAASVVLLFVGIVMRRVRWRRALRHSRRLSSQMRTVMQFVEQNYTDPKLNLAATATATELNESTIRRLLRRETGKNFRELLNGLRLRKAKQLLRESSLSISAVAYEAGYASPGEMSNAFARFEHTSPAHYRAGNS